MDSNRHRKPRHAHKCPHPYGYGIHRYNPRLRLDILSLNTCPAFGKLRSAWLALEYLLALAGAVLDDVLGITRRAHATRISLYVARIHGFPPSPNRGCPHNQHGPFNG